MRRSERIKRKRRAQKITPVKKKQRVQKQEKVVVEKAKRGGWYDVHYKKLLIIPFLMLVASFVIIGLQVVRTGDFIHRGVSLKGGVMITIPTDSLDALSLNEELRSAFPGADIEVRTLEEAGSQVALVVSADITPDDQAVVDRFIHEVSVITGVPKDEFSVETIGSSLGATFFQQTMKALFIAFLFMGLVVFLYFGEVTKVKVVASIASLFAGVFMYSGSLVLNIIAIIIGVGLIVTYAKYSIPSVAVILAAFSDIVVTLAVIDVMGVKLSTAGIAAFLMLIGYSVDTDILLSTRVLKRAGGSVFDRVMSAVKTGLTMNFTTLAAVVVALIFAESEVITQIMTILLIGLIADMINTWFQNVGILRWHLERKGES